MELKFFCSLHHSGGGEDRELGGRRGEEREGGRRSEVEFMDKTYMYTYISSGSISLAILIKCFISFALISDLVSEMTVVTTQYISSLGIYNIYKAMASQPLSCDSHMTTLTFSNFSRFFFNALFGSRQRSAMYSLASMEQNTSESYREGGTDREERERERERER